jgi:hypothetical protein
MLDLLMLAMLTAAFAGAYYVWACQGITGRRSPAWDNSP